MFNFLFSICEGAFDNATSIAALAETQVETGWSYVSAIIGVVWPFVLGVSILFGVIYLIIRVSRGAR